MFWNSLSNLNQLEELFEYSFECPVAIFKHSTTCPISSMAKRRIEQSWPDHISIYYLDLLSYRNISNAVADRFNIIHESPQLIILLHGEVVYHDSHLNIDVKKVEESINKATASEL
jgi:bacillithiol system protein YtxJ